nr:MAG TPA: Mor transcription activator family [Caudoviricetes sp.]
MTISTEITNLTKNDIYSLMLFVMYKLKDSNEYSSLSQLSYILDEENLLKLCEYYGGTTIYIPKIEELEDMLNALLLFQKVDIEKQDFTKCLTTLDKKGESTKSIKKNYFVIKEVLKDFSFNSGR